MLYLFAIFGVAFVWLFAFKLDRLQAVFFFNFYRQLGVAKDRARFVRIYSLAIRIVGIVMILGILGGTLVHLAGG